MGDQKGEEPDIEQPSEQTEATEPEKTGFWGRAIGFLSGTGPTEETHNKDETQQRSFWRFLRSNWANYGEDNDGLLKRFGSMYESYQNLKGEESEKLQTYETIAASARLSKEFLVLLLGSCIIATFGLFQNSTAVIIGAMLIAPLMMPILGLALATVWGDQRLLWRSVFTLVIGSAACLLIAASLTLLTPGVEFNSEINGRINPNLYDIIIALASGLVGAYAFVNPNISSSISGVAIAVALMPPLCTVGIALGLGDLRATFGAGLLYATNLVGISLSASLVFWRLKIHPTHHDEAEVETRAKKNVLTSAILLVIIAVPLGYFMYETFFIKQRQVKAREIIATEIQDSEVLNLQIKKYRRLVTVYAVVVVPPGDQSKKLPLIKNKISALFSEKPQIKLVTLPMTVQQAPLIIEEKAEEEKEKAEKIESDSEKQPAKEPVKKPLKK